MILTTKDVANLPGNFEFHTPNDVAKLCREGKIFGYRRKENFSPWEIPAESFAIYLSYSSAREKTYLDSQTELFISGEDDHMKKVVMAINHAMGRQINLKEETYTIDQISDILFLPKNQIQSMFINSSWPINFLSRIMSSTLNRIPVIRVLDYLKTHPDQLSALQDRHAEMLERKDPRESLIRHTLMLYAYYKDNGYLP